MGTPHDGPNRRSAASTRLSPSHRATHAACLWATLPHQRADLSRLTLRRHCRTAHCPPARCCSSPCIVIHIHVCAHGSPFDVSITLAGDGDASAEHSSVDRTGLEQLLVGEEGTFIVQCTDCFGNATDCGLVSAKATYRGDPEEEVDVKIERDAKGRYSCSLRPMHTGQLEVQALVDGEQIGEVFVVDVRRGAVCAEISAQIMFMHAKMDCLCPHMSMHMSMRSFILRFGQAQPVPYSRAFVSLRRAG